MPRVSRHACVGSFDRTIADVSDSMAPTQGCRAKKRIEQIVISLRSGMARSDEVDNTARYPGRGPKVPESVAKYIFS